MRTVSKATGRPWNVLAKCGHQDLLTETRSLFDWVTPTVSLDETILCDRTLGRDTDGLLCGPSSMAATAHVVSDPRKRD